jgi:hypothetical protein
MTKEKLFIESFWVLLKGGVVALPSNGDASPLFVCTIFFLVIILEFTISLKLFWGFSS